MQGTENNNAKRSPVSVVTPLIVLLQIEERNIMRQLKLICLLYLVTILIPLAANAGPPPNAGPPGGNGPPGAPVPPSATVQVDCAAGDSITEALATPAIELTIEIDGFCSEDIEIRRDLVTLRGKNEDPGQDGIHGATPAVSLGGTGIGEIFESVVLVRAGSGVHFADLFIGEGQANRPGVAISENAVVTLSNTRVENNPGFGVGAFAGAVLFIEDSTVTGNGTNAVVAASSGQVFVASSDLSGGVVSFNNGILRMTGGLLNGVIVSVMSGTVQFSGVSQTGPLILVNGNSSLRALGGSVLDVTLFALVDDFSNFVLREGSTLSSDLLCSSGGDAFCDVPADVSGVSTCGLCPKP